MGEWCAVACEYWLINRCITGAMNLLAQYINFSSMRVNSARILQRSALPQGRVSIRQKDTLYFSPMMKIIIDAIRCSVYNTSICVSTERQRFVVLYVQ